MARAWSVRRQIILRISMGKRLNFENDVKKGSKVRGGDLGHLDVSLSESTRKTSPKSLSPWKISGRGEAASVDGAAVIVVSMTLIEDIAARSTGYGSVRFTLLMLWWDTNVDMVFLDAYLNTSNNFTDQLQQFMLIYLSGLCTVDVVQLHLCLYRDLLVS